MVRCCVVRECSIINLDKALCRAKYKCCVMTTEADEKIKLSSTFNMLHVDDVFPSPVAKLIQFHGQYISLDASDEFDEDAVYESSVINGPVFDFLVVQNGIAYMIQVSNKLPNDHPISVSAMHKVIDSIRSKNKAAKIRYIYVTRETNSDINGIRFMVRMKKTEKDDSTKKRKAKKGALNDLLAMKDKIEEADYKILKKIKKEKKIKMYIVTSPLFDYYKLT